MSGRREAALDRLVGPEPTPEFAAMVAEQYRRLRDGLGDDTLRRSSTCGWRATTGRRSPSGWAAPCGR